MSSREDPRGAVVAAEIAICEGDMQTAEEALLEALSRTRRRLTEADTDE